MMRKRQLKKDIKRILKESAKNNRGATLVELMVSVAIFGIIASAALGLLLYATNVNSDVTADVVEKSRIYTSIDVIKEKAAESEALMVGTDDMGGLKTLSAKTTEVVDGNKVNVFESFVWSSQEKTLTYIPANGHSVVLLTGITGVEFYDGANAPITDDSAGRQYLVLSIETEQGRVYNITIVCKNG